MADFPEGGCDAIVGGQPDDHADGTPLWRSMHIADGTVRVLSDNPAYEPFSVSLTEDTDLKIIGRVVWAGKKF